MPMDSTSLGSFSLVSVSLLTSSMTKLYGSSSMGTKTCPLPTSTNSLSSLTESSCHKNKGVVTLTALLQGPAKVVDAEETRGSNQIVPQNSPSAASSTKWLVASVWTADSPTSVPTALQAATLNPVAHAK